MIIRYAEEKNFIELRQFYEGMCKVLSGKDFLPEGDKGGFPPEEMIKDAIKERNQFIGCIFRKNCASVPEERSAIPLQTEQSSAG